MELIMMLHFQENMNLNEAEMRKTLSSQQKSLINIENYYNQNMNTAEDLVDQLIMYLASM